MKTNNKGFTLVELLAVIVILAVLLGIAMPAISNVQTSAKQGTAEDEAMTFVEAIRTCVMAEGDNTTAVSTCQTKAMTSYMDATGASATVTLAGSDSSNLLVTSFSYKSTQGYVIQSTDEANGTNAKDVGVISLATKTENGQSVVVGNSLSSLKQLIKGTTW